MRILTAVAVACVSITTASAEEHGAPHQQVPFNCLTAKQGCTIVIRLPDGRPGMALKFHYCKGTCDKDYPDNPLRPGTCLLTCDPSTRAEWKTHYLTPPDGEVCHNTDINEALHWLEQNRRGWLLAGWGCVDHILADM
ncbi:MAG: hypothetical protein RLZZ342_310 [Candidatus Parcubacteria bacterium]